MSESTRIQRVTIGAVVGLCVFAALGAARAPESAGGLKVAVVDPSRLINEYTVTQKSNAAIQKVINDYQLKLQTWSQNKLLSDKDQARLGELVVKGVAPGALTAADEAEKKKLTETSAALNTEFDMLQKTQNPNSAQTARQTDLIKLANDTDRRVQEESDNAKGILQKMQGENTTKVLAEVKAGVASVAKKDGYNVVFSSELCWWADHDITEAVLKSINAGK